MVAGGPGAGRQGMDMHMHTFRWQVHMLAAFVALSLAYTQLPPCSHSHPSTHPPQHTSRNATPCVLLAPPGAGRTRRGCGGHGAGAGRGPRPCHRGYPGRSLHPGAPRAAGGCAAGARGGGGGAAAHGRTARGHAGEGGGQARAAGATMGAPFRHVHWQAHAWTAGAPREAPSGGRCWWRGGGKEGR